MNMDFASKGYKVVTGTSATPFNFFGFTPLTDAVLTAIVLPTAGNPEGAYDGDETGAAGPTFSANAFFPLRGSSITLASGSVILWKE